MAGIENHFPMRVPSRKRLLFLLAPMILAAGCARSPVDVPEIVKPYRITIQQGNYVTREMVQQLKPGMTREQVRYVLGTPLLTDIFHADRWDYVFYRDAPGGKREQRNISVMFEDGKLTRVLGDLLPSDPVQEAPKPVAAAEPKAESGAEAKPEEKPEEKPARGFFGRMLEKIGL
ncbi:MAG: outer membrane protein assembly factor BamE [Fimbriimonadaceae bacterium]